MKPKEFKEQNTTYAKDQPEYIHLPACRLGDEFGTVVTCWEFSFLERLKIIFGAKLWWQQLTFRTPLQPVKPTIGNNPIQGK
jgi:hypothetical protein